MLLNYRGLFSHRVGVHCGLKISSSHSAKNTAVSLVCVIFHSRCKSTAALCPPESEVCKETPKILKFETLNSGKVHVRPNHGFKTEEPQRPWL